MKRLFLVYALLILNPLLLLRASNNIEATKEFDLGGLKVIFKENTANEIISAQLFIRGGVLNVSEKNQGIEPFIFSSVTLKDSKYREKSWSKLLEGTGAQLGASAERDFTVVSLRCIKKYFDDLWVVFSDYVMETTFYDERVEVVRQRILSGIRGRKNSPDQYIRSLGEAELYRDHPYRLDPEGVEESIGRITMRQMSSHLKDSLKKSRLLLVVVGNLQEKALMRKISDTFGRLSKDSYQPEYPEMVQHKAPSIKIVEQDLPTNYILGLFAAPSLKDPDYYAMALAIDILKWRLFEEIRTKRNLSYAPDAFLGTSLANFAGIYATSIYPDSTVRIMLGELKKLQLEKIDEKDLRDRINLYLTRYYLGQESNAAQGQFLARFELSGLGWQAGNDFVNKLRSVTPADIQRVASRFFKNIQFVYLGNPDLIVEKSFTAM